MSRGRERRLTNDLRIVQRPLAELKPAKRNARVHSEKQIAQLMGSIEQFGFTNPLLVDSEGRILAGHGRAEAAKRLGMETIPTIALEHLTEEQRRAYVLADNKLALNSGWDRELLRVEFAELVELDIGFELDLTGFSTPEIDVLLDVEIVGKADRDDAVVEPRRWPTTKPGDLWLLGPHRLLCGDSRDPDSFAQLMGDDRARMVFSDPPYNVRIDGHVGGLGAVKHDEFAMASGEMTSAEFTAFLSLAFANAAAVSVDGALHFQCMDWRHADEMLAAGRSVYSDLKNICVWAKDNGGMGSFYRSQHELVFVWKVGTAPHVNNVELGKNGRYRTNVWDYRGATKTGRKAELNLHPTVKPVALVADAIRDAAKRGEIVLDAFAGSGTTLIAAEKTGRRGYVLEIDPAYCDTIVRRWEMMTGKRAIHEASGKSFEDLAEERLAAASVKAGAPQQQLGSGPAPKARSQRRRARCHAGPVEADRVEENKR